MGDTTSDKGTFYGGPPLTLLSPIEAARKRPGMYIGSTDQAGLQSMLWEVVIHSLNEHLAGTADYVAIRLEADGAVTVSNNGPGIPTEVGDGATPTLEVALTAYSDTPAIAGVYKVAQPWSREFLWVANALSSFLVAEVQRGGYLWRQEYERGVPRAEVRPIERTTTTGTSITFWPDTTIFTDVSLDRDLLVERVRATCYLNRGLTAEVTDARAYPAAIWSFHFSDGVRAYVRHLTSIRAALHSPIAVRTVMGTTTIDVALQYNYGDARNVLSFVNSYPTWDDGSHVTGFYSALVRVLNDRGRAVTTGGTDSIMENGSLTEQDVQTGLSAVISVWLAQPSFEGATKMKLRADEVGEQISAAVTNGLVRHFMQEPEDLKRIVRHCHAGHMRQMPGGLE